MSSLGTACVTEFRGTIFAEEDVTRFDIPVDHLPLHSVTLTQYTAYVPVVLQSHNGTLAMQESGQRAASKLGLPWGVSQCPAAHHTNHLPSACSTLQLLLTPTDTPQRNRNPDPRTFQLLMTSARSPPSQSSMSTYTIFSFWFTIQLHQHHSSSSYTLSDAHPSKPTMLW